MTINERIKYFIKINKISQAELAKTIDTSNQTINNICQGKNQPSFDIIQKILIKYPNINARWLLIGNDNEKIMLNIDNKISETCSLCKEKDNRISDLQSEISYLKQIIDRLQTL